MNNKFYFEKFEQENGFPIDIGIDFGNNALKVSYSIGGGGIIDYTPPDEMLDSYNRKSTVFLSFDFSKDKIRSLKDEVYEVDGKMILELDPADLDIFFDFAERIKNPNRVFRCIKSQYYEGVFNKKSEFFNKIAEKSDYRYFLLGELDGITLIINTNLLFDKLYVLCIETVLKDIAPKLSESNPTKLVIRVISSIPLGTSPQLLNDDKKVEDYLNVKLKSLVFERVWDEAKSETSLVFIKGATGAKEVKPVRNSKGVIESIAEIRFKTTYEVFSPLMRVLKENVDERLLLVIKDIGSLTNQTMFVYIDKLKRIIKPFSLDSFYGGGLNFNEEIIKNYCESKQLDPTAYFWDNTDNCYKNFQILEHLKKQILLKKQFMYKGSLLYGNDETSHEIDLDDLKKFVVKFYPRSLEYRIKNYIKNELERFVNHSGGNVKVRLMGESFNPRSETFNGEKIFLKSLGLSFLENEPWNVLHTKDVNYISQTMVKSLDYRMNYTLYDNIAVISEYGKEKFVVFTSSTVGETAELLINPVKDVKETTELVINPIKDGEAEYIMLFTYVKYTQNRLNFDDMGKSTFDALKGKLNTKFVLDGWDYVEGEIEELKRLKPGSFKKPASPYYMVPLFKIKLYRNDKTIPLKLILRFVNTFEVEVEVMEKTDKMLFRQVMKYPLLLDKFTRDLLDYDFFLVKKTEFERKMFSSFCFKKKRIIEEVQDTKMKEKKFNFIFPNGRRIEFNADETEEDSDVDMEDSDFDIKQVEKKKKKRKKKRKRDETEDDSDDDEEEKPKKKKRKKKNKKRKKRKKKKKKKKKKRVHIMKCCGEPRKGHGVGYCRPIVQNKEDDDEDELPQTKDKDFILDEEEDIDSEISIGELTDDTKEINEMILEEKDRVEDQKKDKMDLSDDGGEGITDENDFRPDTPSTDDDYTPSIRTDYLGVPAVNPPPPPPPQQRIISRSTFGVKGLPNQLGGKSVQNQLAGMNFIEDDDDVEDVDGEDEDVGGEDVEMK